MEIRDLRKVIGQFKLDYRTIEVLSLGDRGVGFRPAAARALMTAFTTTMRAKLGEITVEGRRIELVWLTGIDSVRASFTMLAPNRIGTVVGLETHHARLIVCESAHLDWVGDFGRSDLIVVAAIDHYRHREVLARTDSTQETVALRERVLTTRGRPLIMSFVRNSYGSM